MYLIGWLPIGLFVAAGIRQNADWTTAMAFVLPLVVVYAFIGLSTWVLARRCRSTPRRTHGARSRCTSSRRRSRAASGSRSPRDGRRPSTR
jgi:hypothetical protein